MSNTIPFGPGRTRSGAVYQPVTAEMPSVGPDGRPTTAFFTIPGEALEAIGEAADEAAGAVEAADDSMMGGKKSRRRTYKFKGGVGACTDRSRTIIKGLVLSSIGVAGYLGASPAASLVGTWIGGGLSWLTTAKCTVGYPGGIETALCTKYGELLTGISSIIATISGNAALGGITVAGLGAGAVYTVKGAAAATTAMVKSIATNSNAGIDKIVDIICTMLYGSEADKANVKREYGVQTDPDPTKVNTAATAGKQIEAALPPGQKPITAFMTEKAKKSGGRRRSTRKALPKKLGKSRRVRRSKSSRSPMFAY